MERVEKAEVKFKVNFTGQPTPKVFESAELAKWCRIFHEKGLAPSYGEGSSGNLSFRTASGKSELIITASGLPLKDTLSQNDFVLVHSFDRAAYSALASGTKKPSSETALHYAIYEKRPDVNAIFHGHCSEILEKATRLNLRETKQEEDYGSLALVDRVVDDLSDQNFIIMKNHGFVSIGKTMEEAGTRAVDIQRKALKLK
jgi:ribulose-5-phosphate 4-epimerase/fuculose-1-phosphate aldolase